MGRFLRPNAGHTMSAAVEVARTAAAGSVPVRQLAMDLSATGRTVPALLEDRARLYPDRALFAFGDTTFTLSQTRDAVASAAAALATLGIGRGDPVAIMAGNRPEMLFSVMGCAWIGALAIPVNTAAKGPQLSYYLRDSRARLLLIDGALLAVLDHLEPQLLKDIRVLSLGDAPRAPSSPRRFQPGKGTAAAAALGPGDPFVVLYTSGTTGPSKGVVCPHAQFFWWGIYSSDLLGIRSDDTLCTTLPLFHTNALNACFQALLTGATLHIEARFSASVFWPRMVQTRATIIYLLGAMVPILLSRPVTPEERLHRIRTGLSPGVPGQLLDAFEARTSIPLLNGYGSTESNFVIGQTLASRMSGCMGQVVDGFEARVVDPLDNEVPDGQPGELILRSNEPYAFASGYLGKDDKTVEAWRNLWLHTGDRVIRHSDGTFVFVDRIKDVIRRRGENISSFEVEQVLHSHPDIELAAVFAVPSELAEDEVMAAIVLRDGARCDAAMLIAYCEVHLPDFAVPRFIAFEAELPRTESGKVQKFKLRARGVTPETFDRERHGVGARRD
jgi:carnitine-CoA ligase